MKIQYDIYDGELEITIQDTEEKRKQLFDIVIKFMKKYNCYSGEQLQQSDDCILISPEILSDIIDDIIKPETKWKNIQ